MPVRRAESLTTLRVQRRAPNSLADSRHQACLVSDRRTRTPPGRQAALHSSDSAPGSIGVISRGIGGDEHFTSYPVKVAPSVPLTTKRRPDEQSAVSERQLRELLFFICALPSSNF